MYLVENETGPWELARTGLPLRESSDLISYLSCLIVRSNILLSVQGHNILSFHSPAPCSFLNHTAGFHRLRSHCSPTKRINNCQFHISYDRRPKTRNKQRNIIFGEQSCEKSERGEDLDPTTRGVGRRGRGGERLTAARVALEHAEVVVGVLHNLDDMDQIPSSCFPIILFLSLL